MALTPQLERAKGIGAGTAAFSEPAEGGLVGRRIVTFSLAWLLAPVIALAAYGDISAQPPPPASTGSPNNFATGQAVTAPAQLPAPYNPTQPAPGSLAPPPIT